MPFAAAVYAICPKKSTHSSVCHPATGWMSQETEDQQTRGWDDHVIAMWNRTHEISDFWLRWAAADRKAPHHDDRPDSAPARSLPIHPCHLLSPSS